MGGPVEFGRAELERALAQRGLKLAVELDSSRGPAESFRISGNRILAPDSRGLMYGLLEAAEQIRDTGALYPAERSPATPMRGIRIFIHNQDLERDWYYSQTYWRDFFAMLARNRFNRFNLVFAHQTNYMAPPYPFWVALDEFRDVRVPGLTAEQRNRNLSMLRFISDLAADYAIDFTLGMWEHNIQPGMTPMTVGLTVENIGPYSYAALRRVLQACPNIRSVQMRTNSESGIPNDRQVAFYRDYVFRALRDAGRPVTLDLRGWAMQKGMLDAAEHAGVPLRVSSKYWAEDLGRPYQPAETFPGYSFLNFLERPRNYDFYWELWGLGSHRLLLWGDPQYVRRAVPTFRMASTIGFEIDPPLAQKGFGNRPGTWGIFTPRESDRVFWKWEFERYWMFYLLWGRLSYDPNTPDRVWRSELVRRFGAAADDALAAYQAASGVLNEIVAAHLADPNMYIWPEINPGGLIDDYLKVPPSDWRFITNAHSDGSKQTRAETSRRLDRMADNIETALRRAENDVGRRKLPDLLLGDMHEWRSTESDFTVLALLARYHAKKMMAAERLQWFYDTGDEASLAAAKENLAAALSVWEDLVRCTDGVYPDEMAFGPEDVGHWKDKLPYVRQDLVTIAEREDILRRLGRFERGFDFGAAEGSVEPRFTGVDPETIYAAERGFGWVGDGRREAHALSPMPRGETRGTARNPSHFPHDVLFGSSIRGSGPQVFRVRLAEGDYDVALLHPDKTANPRRVKSRNGVADIVFPDGNWDVAGVVIKSIAPLSEPAAWQARLRPIRPLIDHSPPQSAKAGEPVGLWIDITPPQDGVTVRLYYRPVNQLAKFKMMETTGARSGFTIPAEDVREEWDLMYYFEVLNSSGGGWFFPDPIQATPYYVIPTHK